VATVTYPLRRLYGGHFTVAPVSVLVDPVRVRRIFDLKQGGCISEKVLCIYRQQLVEAHLFVINKCVLPGEADLATRRQAVAGRFSGPEILAVSSRQGTNLDAWFARLTGEEQAAGAVMDMDYDVYAGGEELLGWLNGTVQLAAETAFEADGFLQCLAREVQQRLQARPAEIAHLKMTFSPEGALGDIAAVNLVRNDFVPEISLHLEAPVQRGQLIINLCAEAAPGFLGATFREALAAAVGGFPGEFAGEPRTSGTFPSRAAESDAS
jgi:hypothetical protein